MKTALFLMLLLLTLPSFAQGCEPGKVRVTVARVEFESTPGLTPELKSEIELQVKTHVRDFCQLSREMSHRVLDVLQQHGYFKGSVQDPKWKQVGGTAADRVLEVLLVIELGQVYRLKGIDFREQKAFDSQALRATIPLSDGEIFNVEAMRRGLKNLRDLYSCTNGYVNFTPVPNTEIDEEHHLITVTFDLDEGDQFRIGQLTLDGVEPYPGAGKRLLDAWAPHIGEIYNCTSWPKVFLSFLNIRPAPGEDALASALNKLPLQMRTDTESKTVNFDFQFPAPQSH